MEGQAAFLSWMVCAGASQISLYVRWKFEIWVAPSRKCSGMEIVMRKIEIYIHIPFCVRKCLYCDFLSFPSGEKERERYLDALLWEIETQAPKYRDYEADSVFIGGGTPTVLTGEQLGRIMRGIKAGFAFGKNPEITVEANPGTVDRGKLEESLKAGINRISIGAQSLNDRELELLGRVHLSEDFFRAYRLARKAGFQNINVDMMAALPGQKLEGYLDGLKRVTDLEPEHISAYSLIVEEGTPFYERYGREGKREKGTEELPGILPGILPSEEEERLMYERTGELLATQGYGRYEISNYARPGYECRHNIGYWKRHDYVGFGLGAASMVENVRWKNCTDMERYLHCMEARKGQREGTSEADAAEGIQEERIFLSVKEQMEEYMFLGLRLTEGVGKEAFYKAFGRKIEDVYGDVIRRLQGQGLLENGKQVRLTPYGRDVSNYVMAEFLIGI